MLAPLTDPNEINHRLDTVQFFSDQSNEATRANLVREYFFRTTDKRLIQITTRSISWSDFAILALSFSKYVNARLQHEIGAICIDRSYHLCLQGDSIRRLWGLNVSFARLWCRSYIQEIVQSWDSSTILLFQQFSDETGGSQISNLLGNIIDVEESSASDSIVIHEGVSEQLDDARNQYNHLDNVFAYFDIHIKWTVVICRCCQK